MISLVISPNDLPWTMNLRLNRLVALEDAMDELPLDAPVLRELAWIFKPYRQFRMAGLFADGIRGYVSARERGDGRWSYTMGRMSPFVRFKLEAIYKMCNAMEFLEGVTDGDIWSGSDTVGGSPRIRGSRIRPDELALLLHGNDAIWR